jgi:hypothetical protein
LQRIAEPMFINEPMLQSKKIINKKTYNFSAIRL